MLRPWLKVVHNKSWEYPQQNANNFAINAACMAKQRPYKDLTQMWNSQDYKIIRNFLQAKVSLIDRGAFLFNNKICLQHVPQT